MQQARYHDAIDHYQKFMDYITKDNHLWSIGQAHAKLALAHAYSGNFTDARSEIHNALSQMRDWREDDLVLQLLLAEPICLNHEGKVEEAVELTTFIAHHPISWNETKQQARAILDIVSLQLSDVVVQSATERGMALDLESVIANLLEQQTD